MRNHLEIDGVKVGGGAPTFIVAEVAQAHDGSLGFAHSYIDAAADAGADAIKFQTHIARAESTLGEPFRVKFSKQDNNRYEYWQRMEFSAFQWKGLAEHALERGLVFLSSPFSVEAVDLLNDIGVPAWKIGSGEVNNPILMNAIAKTGKPILLSTGMSGWSEIDSCVNSLEKFGSPYLIFQCTSKYPTQLSEIGLNVLDELRERYSVPIGLSDHSGTIYPSVAAISRSTAMLELHVIFDKKMFGPDVIASITFDQLRSIVEYRNAFNEMDENPVDKDAMESELISMKKLFNKSVAMNSDMFKGMVITEDLITVKKPGTGIPAQNYLDCIGLKLLRDVKADEILLWSDLEANND